MIKDWRNYPIEPIEIFSNALGIPTADWARREELSQLRYVNDDLESLNAKNLQLIDLIPLIEAYGSALSCEFLIGNKVILEVTKNTNENDLERFKQTLDVNPFISVYLKIDKSQLALDWYGQIFENVHFPYQFFLYLYPERLEYFLENCTLEQLEQKVYKDHWGDKIVFFVPGQDLSIIGFHLNILGGQFLLNLPPSIYEDKRIKIEEHQRIIQQCQDVLKWQKPWITMMTPWHLFAATENRINDHIMNAIRVHFINSFLLYTSDRTFEQGQGKGNELLISRYSTSQQAVDIGFEKTEHFDISSILSENIEALLHIFEWAYDAQWKANDRLPLVQIGIVDALKGSPNSLRFKLLLENAPNISENITWHWKAFVEGKIDAYLEQVQSLEEQVGKTVNAYSEQISSIINSLTETILAAIAVILGSFIASLFQEKFNPVVFRIGLVTYAIYVILFPLLYNMKHRWECNETLEKEFNTQKGWFEKRLPPERVKSIVEQSQIRPNKERFKRWFWLTVAIYVLVFGLLLLGAFIIPGWIQVSAAQPVTPAPTILPIVLPTTTIIP